MTRSQRAFADIVWPRIRPKVGGGDIIPVESVTATGFSKSLDTLAGIDAWQVVDNVGIRGMATRVQFGCSRPWPTFTIRYKRDSGARTEYEKRLEDIENERLYPQATVQAYVSNDRLQAAAVVRTRQLYQFARKHEPFTDDRTQPVYTNRTSNSEFIVVKWDALRAEGVPLAVE